MPLEHDAGGLPGGLRRTRHQVNRMRSQMPMPRSLVRFADRYYKLVSASPSDDVNRGSP